MSDGVGPRGREPHDFLGVSDVQQKLYWGGEGAGVIDGDSSESCLSGVVRSLRSLS